MLTSAGAELLPRVRPKLEALKDTLSTLPEREEAPSGELRITAPVDIGAFWLPAVLSGFAIRYPAVRIHLRLLNRAVDLVAGGFDLALRASVSGKLADSSLVARRLGAFEQQVFAAPTYLARSAPVKTAADAADHAWVAFQDARWPSPLLAPSQGAQLVVDDFLVLREAVTAGMGLGLMPTFLVRDHVAGGTLVRVLPRVSFQRGALHLLHPPSPQLPRKVTAFRDVLIQHIALHPLVGESAGGR